MIPVMEIEGASFSYGQKDIFKNLNLKVGKSQIFCLVGPNGCGKTTLLESILGIQKLKAGNIYVEGKNILSISHKNRAEKIAYIPQNIEKTFPYTVKDMVIMGRAHNIKLFQAPSKEDKLIAMDAMKRMGILNLAEKPFTQISGGEKRLVMIARALTQESKILVMDEPTAHLDFKNELMLLEIIVDIIKKEGITVIMATHFPNHAYYFENNGVKTKLALMKDGDFAKVGTPTELLNEKNIMRIYSINSQITTCKIDKETFIKQIIPISIIKEGLENSGGDIN